MSDIDIRAFWEGIATASTGNIQFTKVADACGIASVTFTDEDYKGRIRFTDGTVVYIDRVDVQNDKIMRLYGKKANDTAYTVVNCEYETVDNVDYLTAVGMIRVNNIDELNLNGTDSVLQVKTITPSDAEQDIYPDSGYDGFSHVICEAIPPTPGITEVVETLYDEDWIINGTTSPTHLSSTGSTPLLYYSSDTGVVEDIHFGDILNVEVTITSPNTSTASPTGAFAAGAAEIYIANKSNAIPPTMVTLTNSNGDSSTGLLVGVYRLTNYIVPRTNYENGIGIIQLVHSISANASGDSPATEVSVHIKLTRTYYRDSSTGHTFTRLT